MPDLEQMMRESTVDGVLHSLAMVRRSDGCFDVAIRIDGEKYFRVAVDADPVAALKYIFEVRKFWPLMSALAENLKARETVSHGT
jgi:hypothetical protein